MDPTIVNAWLNLMQGQELSREERANKYHTKKVMLKAHGNQAYYDIQFPLEQTVYCHVISPLQCHDPLAEMQLKPELVGMLADLLEEIHKYEPGLTEIPAPPPRPITIERDLTQGLTDLSSALGQYKKKNSGDPFNFVV